MENTDEKNRLQQLQQEVEELKSRLAELTTADATEEVKAEEDAEKAIEDAPEETAEETADEAQDADEEEIKAIGKDFDVPEEEIKSAIDKKLTKRQFADQIKTFNFNKKEHKTMSEFRNFLKSGDAGVYTLKRDYTGFGGQVGEAGAGLINPEQYPIVAALQKRIGVKGFRTISGLRNQVTIPVQTGRQEVKIKDFHNGADETNPAFTNKTLTAHLLTGECRIGKDLLLQVNDDIQGFVIDSLTREIAYKIQDYMLSKVNAGAANTVTYSALSAIDWNDVLMFEAYTGAYDLETAFVMSPAARAALKGIEKAQNTARFICEDNQINGYKVNVSGCVSNNNIFFGDWSRLILAEFGDGLEIQLDPYTYSSTGDVKIVARIGIDACLDGNAFVLGKVEESSSSSGSSN